MFSGRCSAGETSGKQKIAKGGLRGAFFVGACIFVPVMFNSRLSPFRWVRGHVRSRAEVQTLQGIASARPGLCDTQSMGCRVGTAPCKPWVRSIGHDQRGICFFEGKLDSFASLERSEILDNASEIVKATDLPVSADLEDGFGAAPEICAKTIRLASEAGLVGGSIEDATGDPATPIYELSHAIERVQAAAEAARDRPFLLTARADNFLCGRRDLDDTIRRLQAFSAAGADVLYAPGLPDLETIRTVCAAVDKPVNVVMGLNALNASVAELSDAGVRRISVEAHLRARRLAP